MNHFLRLLFVGIILLICLGLSEDRSNGMDTSDPVEHSAAISLLQTGTLPTPPENLVPVICDRSHSLPDNALNKGTIIEQNISKSTLTMIHLMKYRLMEYRPDLFTKSGQIFHLSTGREVPPLT